MTIKNRVENLRKLMKENNIDAYIIPSFDANQSEYVAEYWKSREWISGFSGSAGTVVVTLDDAGLWADGRYFIQAEKELENSGIRLFKILPGVPTYPEWLVDTLSEGNVIGFDGYVFSVSQVRQLELAIKDKNISFKTDKDLIGELWEDRPAIPNNEIFIHDVKYAGKSRVEKLNEVREEMKKQFANHYLLTSLDDIAWLMNIRGSDVPNTPVVTSNVVVTEETSYLFIDGNKVPSEVKSELETEGVRVRENHELEGFLNEITNSVLYNPNRVNFRLYNAINTKKVEQGPDITTNLKAIKNDVELENFRNCEVKDGVAMVKFIKWLKENIDKEEITEISAEEKLIAFRSEQELFAGPSFDAIFGYKDHAAMMHYKAKPETQHTLKREGMFLMDSGGQYFDGTTDTTRTVVLGELTEREKRDFTLVLQGFIGLSAVKFLKGATDSHLDVLARQPIWQHGLDYKCGTGHGVGFFLSIHEGPQSIRNNGVVHTVLEKGMILTNEPGIYLEGQYGIRTENMMVVVEDEETEFGQFMKFEAITYCPIDLNGVNVDMLTAFEKNWLNEYHSDVYGKLSPYLNKEEKAWLQVETREI